jgi:hypothetical protein
MEPTPTPAPAGITNPLDGILPDFSVFGAEFTAWWQKLLGGLWAVCLIAAVVSLMIALVKLHKATTNNIPGQADEAKSAAVWAGAAVGALAGLAVIVGGIFALAS